MKTRTTFILSLTAIITLAAGSAFGAYSGGTGEPNDPYQIADVNDLLALAANTADYGKCFILTADINLTGLTFTLAPIAPDTSTSSGFQGIKFIGVFDGNDNIISNLDINQPSRDYIGLFGYVGSGGQIKNLGVEDVNMHGDCYVGGLVGWNYGGAITNCYSTGLISGTSGTSYCLGGLIGMDDSGTITNCYSTVSVSGSDSVGGLVGMGESYYSTITSCYATGAVTATGTTYSYVGGLVGLNDGTITNCYSTGSVSGNSFVGGMVGYNNKGAITNCYNTGSASGSSNVGGLVGINDGGTVTNCYSTVSVSGSDYVGGLVGSNFYGTITSCYATGAIGGSSYVGGLVGENYQGRVIRCYSTGKPTGTSSVGGLCGSKYTGGSYEDTSNFWDTESSEINTSVMGTGKTTVEMKTLSTFTDAGWDFINVWAIGQNQTYPYLKTEPAGDLNYDKKVDFADFSILASHWLEGI